MSELVVNELATSFRRLHPTAFGPLEKVCKYWVLSQKYPFSVRADETAHLNQFPYPFSLLPIEG